MYRFVPATLDHVDEIVRDMDPLIREELSFFSDNSFTQTVTKIIKEADEAWVAANDDGIICLFSVRRPYLLSDVGYAGLITTYRVHQHKRNFLLGAKISVREWKKKYAILTSYIPEALPKFVRWAEWLGFTVFPAQPLGRKQFSIHKIEMR
jgi:hypothetical protein